MQTGEGKTLVATLPVYLNALSGNGVHMITVNDYLARRDAEWCARIATSWLPAHMCKQAMLRVAKSASASSRICPSCLRKTTSAVPCPPCMLRPTSDIRTTESCCLQRRQGLRMAGLDRRRGGLGDGAQCTASGVRGGRHLHHGSGAVLHLLAGPDSRQRAADCAPLPRCLLLLLATGSVRSPSCRYAPPARLCMTGWILGIVGAVRAATCHASHMPVAGHGTRSLCSTRCGP